MMNRSCVASSVSASKLLPFLSFFFYIFLLFILRHSDGGHSVRMRWSNRIQSKNVREKTHVEKADKTWKETRNEKRLIHNFKLTGTCRSYFTVEKILIFECDKVENETEQIEWTMRLFNFHFILCVYYCNFTNRLATEMQIVMLKIYKARATDRRMNKIENYLHRKLFDQIDQKDEARREK